jgi:hypothetical protein
MRIRPHIAAMVVALLAAGPAAAQVVLGTTGDMNAPPLEWAGKLRGKLPDGNGFYCSAQFIAPRVVLTAGHCIKNLARNTFNSGFAFFLQYKSGGWTHVYHGLCWSVPAAYSLPADYGSRDERQRQRDVFTADQYDYGMILVDSPSATGSFPSWAGSWKEGDWHGATKIGYPADVAAGQVIQVAHGALIFADDIPILGVPAFPRLLALWQDNPSLTEGTSGGGWVGNFGTAEGPRTNVLVSVTSFHFLNHPEMSYGPQFDSDLFKQMLDHVAAGGCLGH